MCGFAGIINSSETFENERIVYYASKVAFRGPDSCGVRILDSHLNNTTCGNSAIFFNRLAIIDVDHRSDQPFEDDRFLLVFNGEIYNYKELRSILISSGLHFHTTSDTEVLFNALKHWGTDALPKLNGMFSFCWIDKKEQRMFLARDRLGIKPLYYRKLGNSVSFSSELHSILRLSGNFPEISREATDMFLWMQFIPTPYTIFKGIYKLPPGNFITVNVNQNENISPVPYWDAYDFVQNHEPIQVSEHGLEDILKDSIGRQLQADVPLGLFLSSGVDSSLLAAMVNKHFAGMDDVNFFTVQFSENTMLDESKDAQNFIQGFNNDHLHCHTIRVSPDSIQDHISELYDFYDEPFGDPASLLNWIISKKAREHVTVAISGDGADELFWGYERYNRWQRFSRINSSAILSKMARGMAERLPETTFSDNLIFVTESDPIKRHFNFFLPSGMRRKIRNSISQYPLWAMQGVEKISGRKDLPAILDLKTYLADAMLYKVDRSSMASSLEVRVPYLDNKMLEYALGLPLSAKSNKVYKSKAPLKQLLKQLAPHYDLNRTKKGFNFPLQKWLKANMKDTVLSTVNKADLESVGLEPAFYMKIVRDFYSSANTYFTDVWYIFNLMLWMKNIRKIRKDQET